MEDRQLKYGWIAQVGDLREICTSVSIYIDSFAFRPL